jgi:hypothetical protein
MGKRHSPEQIVRKTPRRTSAPTTQTKTESTSRGVGTNDTSKGGVQMAEGEPPTEIFGHGNSIKAIKQLRDESGASLRDALKDADFDAEEAR